MFFKKFDIFISHAVEDKENIANEFNRLLQENGIKTWYSGERLDAAHNLDELIKKGIQCSRHGVAIFTPIYLKKNWTIRELHAMWAQKGLTFYVLHGVGIEDVEQHCGRIVNDWALDTQKGLDHVVGEITRVIKEHRIKRRWRNFWASTFVTIIPLMSWLFSMPEVPSDDTILAAIHNRTETFQTMVANDYQTEIGAKNGANTNIESIQEYFYRFSNLNGNYRNNYYLENGYHKVNSKKQVESALNIKLDALSLNNSYGFSSSQIHLINKDKYGQGMDIKYILLNNDSLTYDIEEQELEDETNYFVTVSYRNNLRYVSIHLRRNKNSGWMKIKTTFLKGFHPEETYHFEKEGDEWVFVGLK